MQQITASEIVESIESTLRQQKGFDFEGMSMIINIMQSARNTIAERAALIKKEDKTTKRKTSSKKKKKP